MAIKISELNSNTAPNQDSEIAIAYGGSSRKVKIQDLFKGWDPADSGDGAINFGNASTSVFGMSIHGGNLSGNIARFSVGNSGASQANSKAITGESGSAGGPCSVFIHNNYNDGGSAIIQLLARSGGGLSTACNIDMSYNIKAFQIAFNQGQQNGIRVVDGATQGTTSNPIVDGSAVTGIHDNKTSMGNAGFRWTQLHAATSTIATSDINLKDDIEDLSQSERNAASKIKNSIKKYRWKDAKEQKGENARIHVGVIAQEVQKIFEDEGLDAHRYAIFCEDTFWKGEEEMGSEGETRMMPVTSQTEKEGYEKVTRLGVRYEQLLAFIISAL
jgi:hypothetical protein